MPATTGRPAAILLMLCMYCLAMPFASAAPGGAHAISTDPGTIVLEFTLEHDLLAEPDPLPIWNELQATRGNSRPYRRLGFRSAHFRSRH